MNTINSKTLTGTKVLVKVTDIVNNSRQANVYLPHDVDDDYPWDSFIITDKKCNILDNMDVEMYVHEHMATIDEY